MRHGLLKHRSLRNGAPKVFAVGFNKTGTTSVGAALSYLGLKVGDQWAGELLLHDWARRRFTSIEELCRTADAFQDVPFSLDYTYQRMDIAFPGSKFILTVRPSRDWYASLIGHHKRLTGVEHVPTADDLRHCEYRREGWLLEANQLIFGVDETRLYDRVHYIKVYERHNDSVIDYFRSRPESLLVLDVSDPDAFTTLASFVGRPLAVGIAMPHLNRAP